MKYLLFACLACVLVSGCFLSSSNVTKEPNKELAALFERYYEDRMKLYPLEATSNGDNRYNNILKIDFTDSYRDSLKTFYSNYLAYVTKYDREKLNSNDEVSYDIFKREMEMNLEGLTFKDNYIPFQQFWGLTLTMGQLGSGDGNQPFKTPQDYSNWISRATRFSAWADSSIIYFRKGLASGIVLPKALVEKMIPQMDAMVVASDTASLFYGPIKKIPAGFSQADKDRLSNEYVQLIHQQLVPAYKRLSDFLKNEYLPKARTTSGIAAIPEGEKYYNYEIRYWTTTNKTPDEIYNTGLAEVKRIRGLMDSVRTTVGFKADLNSFFNFMRNDKQFMPFKTPEDVLNGFRNIQHKIQPNLSKMFGRTPKTPFEVRQTEAFRAASASAEYNQGSPDGSRPGIFYVPIIDATTYNTTGGFESLFLHEAIPGHHYQISLQQENESLPKFRRFRMVRRVWRGVGIVLRKPWKRVRAVHRSISVHGCTGR
jgi:uncharacterized protein (DUF885 family)